MRHDRSRSLFHRRDPPLNATPLLGTDAAGRATVLGVIGGVNCRGTADSIIWLLARPGRHPIRACSPRPKGANGGGAERSAVVGARPTVANPGGTPRCAAVVGTEAAPLGILRRGFIAAVIAGRRNAWNEARNAKSRELTLTRDGSCCHVLVSIPGMWRLSPLNLSISSRIWRWRQSTAHQRQSGRTTTNPTPNPMAKGAWRSKSVPKGEISNGG